MIIRKAAFTALLVCSSIAARAEGLRREFTITPEVIKEAPGYVAQVVVPDATCAAVSESSSMLVVGRKGSDEKNLAVFRLDADGHAAGEPTWITLPKPEALAGNISYPLGLLFHPNLPVLYVWQDTAVAAGKTPDLSKYAEFDHLLTYAIKDGALELVQTGARGSGFHCGLNAGTIGLDRERKNLFVPNAQGASYDEAGFGFYALDEEGIPGDTPESTNDKAVRKPEMTTNVSKNPGKKAIRVVTLPRQLRTNHYFPSGAGWFAGTEAMLMGGYSGCMMADFHDGGLRQTWLSFPDRTGPSTLAAHPNLPMAYICLQDNLQLMAIMQVNGYLTLLPQLATVTGAHFIGVPVVVTGQSRLAIGDAKALHLLGLQPDGRFDGKDERLTLPCASVRGLAYSEKFNRLFVAVDKGN